MAPLRITIGLCILAGLACPALADSFTTDVQPLLTKYCIDCHGPDEANADIDVTALAERVRDFDLWEMVVDLVNDGIMPPAEETQPSEQEKQRLNRWYQQLVESAKPHPGYHRPRRLSAHEYRNTLESVFGFELDIAIIDAEQTVSEKSLVMKLLPTDPPGPSGFKNDTSGNPLSTLIWDQYSYLVDNGLERLFSAKYRDALEALVGKTDGQLSREQAEQLIRDMMLLAYRRPVDEETVRPHMETIRGTSDAELPAALRAELKTILMSPRFIYRGLMVELPADSVQAVDDFELAERLSYFLWADMPDETLMTLADANRLSDPDIYHGQIDRMLASPKARNLAEDMGVQWFSLGEIDLVSNNPPVADALRTQPIDFLHYLFTGHQPLIELIDSQVSFINPHTAKFYPDDRKQMVKYKKQKGIEIESIPNQQIKLEQTSERGGLLTMPGVLAMNKGPVLRGTWILERVLGEHLPDPPANVGQVQPNRRGEKLTFRQRFEQHRSNPSCAACHDKIDPLGFALEAYAANGGYIRSPKYASMRGKVKKNSGQQPDDPQQIDTSGRLPSGETFEDFQGLKQILITSQKETVIRNIVRRTMSYALCRKLEIHDRPTVEAIVQRLRENDGTYRDLIYEIADSLPFRKTAIRTNDSE